MANYFGFMDETGTLSNDPNQRFFVLGLLRIERTSELFEIIKRLKDRHRVDKGFEFKFNAIKKDSHLPIFKELVDSCLDSEKFYFSCIVVDRLGDAVSVPTTTWDAQIDLAKAHVDANIPEGSGIALVADYLTKPASSNRFFEDELCRLGKVFNACMLESDASVFVQVVDVLIGCVAYRYKIEHQLAGQCTPKGKLVCYLEDRLEVAFETSGKSSGNFRHKKNLIGGFTIYEPYYFSVYEKRGNQR